jgi:dihydroorotate dehydrogenase (fumarate)
LSLALTGGVHDPIDAVKAVMAGADCVQIVSALLEHGPARLTRIRDEVARWGDAHGYASMREMRGCMSLAQSSDPQMFERGNYMRILSAPWFAAH